jgi:putative flippase GtrA
MSGEWRRLLRFLAVGGLNTAFGYATYAVFVLLHAPLWLAVAAATVLTCLFNFASYGGLVFGTMSHRLLPRFLLFYISLGALNVGLLRLLRAAEVDALLAQALLLPILAASGYLGLRGFVFREQRP